MHLFMEALEPALTECHFLESVGEMTHAVSDSDMPTNVCTGTYTTNKYTCRAYMYAYECKYCGVQRHWYLAHARNNMHHIPH